MDKDSKKEIMLERMNEKKSELKTVRKIVLIVSLVVLVIGIIGGLSVYKYITNAMKPVDPDSEDIIEVEIPIGSGLDSIASKLEKSGIIRDAKIFKYYAKFNNESQFQAGSYGLTKAMTFDELIKSLKTGKVYREPVFTMTVPEGLTLKQIATVVEKRTGHKAEDFMNLVTDDAYIDSLIAKYPNVFTEEIKNENIKFALEGYLYPATYPFYDEKPTLQTIVDQMVEATVSQVTPHLDYLRQHNKSVHWLLTFASLLEEEATSKSDREVIASVFVNRLEKGMPLQTDPTVLYALGEHKSKVLLSHLEVDDPYNTYKNTGLPPGPIANAGKASIDAAIDPAVTDYFYFLADSKGENYFSVTYEEHLRKKAEYIDGK